MQAHVGLGFSTASERRAGGLSIIQAAHDSALRLRSASRRNPIQFPTNTEQPNRADANKIQGCDFHPGFQQVAIFDNRTGEMQEKRLQHRAEAEQFYGSLRGQEVRVGMEACGHYPWFERLLAELGFELWLGAAAKIRASVVRQQKTDRRDALQLLQLLMEERFPRIWVPSLEERDLRQLLVHRHKQ